MDNLRYYVLHIKNIALYYLEEECLKLPLNHSLLKMITDL